MRQPTGGGGTRLCLHPLGSQVSSSNTLYHSSEGLGTHITNARRDSDHGPQPAVANALRDSGSVTGFNMVLALVPSPHSTRRVSSEPGLHDFAFMRALGYSLQTESRLSSRARLPCAARVRPPRMR